MGANIPEWTKAATGTAMTPAQFLKDEGAQDATFHHRFGSYVDKYGTPEDAASAWFTGQPRSASSGERSDVLGTTGNPEGHLVLRGGSRTGPNYAAKHIAQATDLLKKAAVPPAIIVDCSHGNSGKQHDQQLQVATDLAAQVAGGERAIIGFMLESNLVGGAQKYEPGKAPVYGQSITDACLSFDETGPVLEKLAQAAAARRGKKA
jgi:phospho-2-dehydro-3-deoxyheptonate aldolase